MTNINTPVFTIANVLIFITLAVGIVLTINGLSGLTWPAATAWGGKSALIRFIGFLFGSAFLVFFISKRFKLNAGLAMLVASSLAATYAGAIWPLIVVFWFAISVTILGDWLLKKLKLEGEDWHYCFLVGAGCYGSAVGLLAHFSVNYQWIYSMALAIPLILRWRAVADKCKHLAETFRASNLGVAASHRLDVIIAAIALVYFIVALMPELGHDSLATHLFVPAHLAIRHQWSFDVGTYVWAVMPMLADNIYAICYMLGGETATRLINIGFIYILGLLVRDLVIWAGGTLAGARWAVLIYLTTPLTFTEGSSLYIESVWASFVVAGSLSLLRACMSSEKPYSSLVVAGILLGFAMATKAITLTWIPALILLFVWKFRTRFLPIAIPYLAKSIGLFILIGIVPYATAWWLTGNPVFPMFNKIFHSPLFPPVNFDNLLYKSGITWDVIYRVTFETGKYLEANAGASGFQWMILLIPSVISLTAFRQNRGAVMLSLGVISIIVTFHSQSYLRYIFPGLIIFAAVIGLALSRVQTCGVLSGRLWLSGVVMTIILNLLFINTGNGFYRDFPLDSIVDETHRANYLRGRIPIRNAVELINQLNIERQPVAVFAHPLTAGLAADALYPNWYNYTFQNEIASTTTEHELSTVLVKHSVNYIIFDAYWTGAEGAKRAEMRSNIERISEKIAEYGSISIFRIKNEYYYSTELLLNSDFTQGHGWNSTKGANINQQAGILRVDINSFVTQGVAIKPNTKYLNTVVARCKTNTMGRIQINWHDSEWRYIKSDIKVFECQSDWAVYSMTSFAPENAAYAQVYTVGHTSTPLEFKSNSLKQWFSQN